MGFHGCFFVKLGRDLFIFGSWLFSVFFSQVVGVLGPCDDERKISYESYAFSFTKISC